MKKTHVNADLIISVLTILSAILIAGFAGDYFFDLNDDVLMKDILSGAYTGVPEGHNIQMLYPISLFVSILYRIGTNIDWYGIFLCFIQYFCFFIVVKKSIAQVERVGGKVFIALSELAVIIGFFLPHLLFVQYTVVCGLMSATAAFLIFVSDKKDHILALLLLVVAYLLRSEMLLLTLPMVGVAIFMKWLLSRDGADDKKALFKKYVVLSAAIVIGLGACSVLHNAGYSSPEWKEFNRLFDNRTELYDFQYIPDYEENKEFYDSIGLSQSEQKLLENYNFALDDEIDADILGEVAAYASATRGEEAPVGERLYKALRLYIYRLHHMALPAGYEYPMSDLPWNLGAIILYIGVVVLYAFGRDENGQKKEKLPVVLFLLALLFVCRSALWMFIIFRGRDPIRITHTLYLVEILILLGFVLRGWNFRVSFGKLKFNPAIVILAILLLSGCVMIAPQYKVASNEQAKREETVANYQALYDYMKSQQDSFYYIDVYTSVSYAAVAGTNVAPYTEKMFAGVDNSTYNHDIMGGWASKSPLFVKKLQGAGFESVQGALLEENVYFVQNKTEDTSWLSDYYKDKGYDVTIEEVTVIADIFAIYKVNL